MFRRLFCEFVFSWGLCYPQTMLECLLVPRGSNLFLNDSCSSSFNCGMFGSLIKVIKVLTVFGYVDVIVSTNFRGIPVPIEVSSLARHFLV